MISTTIQRYILLTLTTICLGGSGYIGLVIYRHFYVPIFTELTISDNQPNTSFPPADITAVLNKLEAKRQTTVDTSGLSSPFASIPSNVTEPDKPIAQ